MKKSIKIPRKIIKKKMVHDCLSCANMIPIGEGDHICLINPTNFVLIDYTPTETYCFCNGEDWEEL